MNQIANQNKNELTRLRSFHVEELKWETPDIFTLVLAPDAGERMFEFKAGQWVYLHLLNADGTSWARAAFSVASAPEESGEGLELGIKVYGDFTKRASQLMPDDPVALQGPFGVFTIKREETPQIVLFAGGIGISPLRSMIRSLAARKSTADVTLFYSNKKVEDIAYFEEFDRLVQSWPTFHPVFILTQESPPDWKGETTRLDEPMLKRHLRDFSHAEFFMCGPPGFMEGIKSLLEKQGVDLKSCLHKELFG